MKLAEFEPLGPAEQKLVDWLTPGHRGLCVISDGVPKAETPETRIGARLIRYLALGGCDACRPPETGVQVQGAWIAGDDVRGAETKGLDFEGATLPGDLALIACRIPDPILLRSARVRNLFLNRSHLNAGIAGDRLQAEGDVFLPGAEVDGTVRLPGAQIGGDLDCADAKLRSRGEALLADGTRITGTLLLREGAELAAELSLSAAEIGAISDDPACWPPRIDLDRCRYGAILGNAAPTDAKSRLD